MDVASETTQSVVISHWIPLTPQSMHTCCLLCHREFKDWGAGQVNGLPGHGSKLAEAVPALSQALLREVPGRKLADAVPALSQSLLGEVPLWICQSCRKSVEEEERRTILEQTAQVIEISSGSFIEIQIWWTSVYRHCQNALFLWVYNMVNVVLNFVRRNKLYFVIYKL